MQSLLSRILVAFLVVSQTWTGALRGLEFCIPVGLCEGCGVWFVSAHSHHGHSHEEMTCAHHRAHHEIHHEIHHERDHGAHHQRDMAVGDSSAAGEGCHCHIHVETPDDDTHRGTPPATGLILVAPFSGDAEPWILAAWLRVSASPPAFPPDDPLDQAAPSAFEQALIEATMLLV